MKLLLSASKTGFRIGICTGQAAHQSLWPGKGRSLGGGVFWPSKDGGMRFAEQVQHKPFIPDLQAGCLQLIRQLQWNMLIDCTFRVTDASAPAVKVCRQSSRCRALLAATATCHGLSHLISPGLSAVKAFLVIWKQRQNRVSERLIIWNYPYSFHKQPSLKYKSRV